MSEDRLEKIVSLAKRTPPEEFALVCPGHFILVTIPGKESDDDDLEFHTRVLGSTPYRIGPRDTAFDMAVHAGKEKDAPGNYIFEIKKTANNGWLEWIALGRAKNNDVILRHQSVSKLHARIHKEYNGESGGLGEEMWITDMNSSTGTWVNSTFLKPSDPHRLSPGDSIRFGQVDCEFVSGKSLHAAALRI